MRREPLTEIVPFVALRIGPLTFRTLGAEDKELPQQTWRKLPPTEIGVWSSWINGAVVVVVKCSPQQTSITFPAIVMLLLNALSRRPSKVLMPSECGTSS